MENSLRSLFFDLAGACEQASGLRFKRSHVYQLVASAFGFGSWEAFRLQSVLADGVGTAPPLETSDVLGRALQLDLGTGQALKLAIDTLVAGIRARDLRSLEAADLFAWALTYGKWPVNGDWEFAPHSDDDEQFDDDVETDESAYPGNEDSRLEWLRSVRSSGVLRASLADRAAAGDANSHLVLAAILRCRKPNSYLHDEEQRGRRLNASEQAMKAEFLDSVGRFPVYAHHLREAAKAGIAQAAVECAYVLSDDRWLREASYHGDSDLLLAAAEFARDDAMQIDYLLRGSETSYQNVLVELAAQGHPAGVEHLASHGDRNALISMSTTALQDGDPELAWSWQLVAQAYGLDLQDAAARALHSEGPQTGDPYDDDIGGPVYIEEQDVIDLPQITKDSLTRARRHAHEIVAGARISKRHKEHGWR
ncbi:hypothetical protein [uncultured Ramlibacter sp.]|uniref:hypothetical protein n=1 Tax=uncultured Ramlibacter sp. TaxID=260755 RepID=UPI00263363F9|nr:hypothetical protein [uncultured Ramlibacter sp.]